MTVSHSSCILFLFFMHVPVLVHVCTCRSLCVFVLVYVHVLTHAHVCLEVDDSD